MERIKALYNNHILLYALVLAVCLAGLKWLDTHLLIIRHSFDIYAGIIAVVFLCIGIWVSKKIWKPVPHAGTSGEQVKPSQPLSVHLNTAADHGLSQREQEVLWLIASGLSNQEIADTLFVSTNTVKTHIANLYGKLDVKRRTQAIQRSRELGLIS